MRTESIEERLNSLIRWGDWKTVRNELKRIHSDNIPCPAYDTYQSLLVQHDNKVVKEQYREELRRWE